MSMKPSLGVEGGALPENLTALCMYRNGSCRDFALWIPKLCIPVRGHPECAPYEVMLQIELCKAHFRYLRAADYLTAIVRGGAKHHMRQAGAEPNFARAFFKPLHITAPEYRQFQAELRGERQASDTIAFDGTELHKGGHA